MGLVGLCWHGIRIWNVWKRFLWCQQRESAFLTIKHPTPKREKKEETLRKFTATSGCNQTIKESIS